MWQDKDVNARRPTIEELEALCQLAARAVPIGSLWRHWSKPDVYEIIAITEDDGQIKAVYRNIAAPEGSLLTHSRRYEEFFDTVRVPDNIDPIRSFPETRTVKRFERVVRYTQSQNRD